MECIERGGRALIKIAFFEDEQRWDGLKRVRMIESERRIDGQPTTSEQHYYLTGLDGGVARTRKYHHRSISE